jgi:hypothetical protein
LNPFLLSCRRKRLKRVLGLCPKTKRRDHGKRCFFPKRNKKKVRRTRSSSRGSRAAGLTSVRPSVLACVFEQSGLLQDIRGSNERWSSHPPGLHHKPARHAYTSPPQTSPQRPLVLGLAEDIAQCIEAASSARALESRCRRPRGGSLRLSFSRSPCFRCQVAASVDLIQRWAQGFLLRQGSDAYC